MSETKPFSPGSRKAFALLFQENEIVLYMAEVVCISRVSFYVTSTLSNTV